MSATTTSARRRLILIQGTADWHQPIATNQHYIVRELAKTFDVAFIESLGLRRIEFRWRDVRRILRRVLRLAAGTTKHAQSRPVPEHVVIISPIILPFHTNATRGLNAFLLGRSVARALGHRRWDAYWTYSPVTYGLESKSSATIYHCVDLLHAVGGIPPALILASEARLSRITDLAVGSSQAVCEHLAAANFQHVEFWPNVADTDVMRCGVVAGSVRRPAAVFAGNLSTQKVDFGLLNYLVSSGVELHLAGPVDEGGGDARLHIRALVDQGCTYHGLLTLADLSDLYGSCTVGLIPYVLNEYTRGVSPLKTFEYLATGLAVVATPLPSLTEIEDAIWIASDAERFVQTVSDLARDPCEPDRVAYRQLLAEQHSWSGRGALARQRLDDLLSGCGAHKGANSE